MPGCAFVVAGEQDGVRPVSLVSAATVAAASGRSRSAMPRTPITVPCRSTATAVLPLSSSLATTVSCGAVALSVSSREGEPTWTVWPSTVAVTPSPGTEEKPVTAGR